MYVTDNCTTPSHWWSTTGKCKHSCTYLWETAANWAKLNESLAYSSQSSQLWKKEDNIHPWAEHIQYQAQLHQYWQSYNTGGASCWGDPDHRGPVGRWGHGSRLMPPHTPGDLMQMLGYPESVLQWWPPWWPPSAHQSADRRIGNVRSFSFPRIIAMAWASWTIKWLISDVCTYLLLSFVYLGEIYSTYLLCVCVSLIF